MTDLADRGIKTGILFTGLKNPNLIINGTDLMLDGRGGGLAQLPFGKLVVINIFYVFYLRNKRTNYNFSFTDPLNSTRQQTFAVSKMLDSINKR